MDEKLKERWTASPRYNGVCIHAQGHQIALIPYKSSLVAPSMMIAKHIVDLHNNSLAEKK